MKALPKGAGTTPSPGTLASEEASARHRSSWLASISAWLENEAVLGYVLLTPALLLIVVFIAYPFSLGVWLSLTDKLVGRPAHFIGLRNFTHLFESQIFLGTVWNTVLFTFSATVLKAVLGMWLAVLLNRKIRFARFIRATVLLPFIVPTVLSGLAWVWMFDATFSVFNWIAALALADHRVALQRGFRVFSRPQVARRLHLGHVLYHHGEHVAWYSLLCYFVSRRVADRADGVV